MKTSNIIFFEPNERFFDYFSKVPWRYKQFHECGAGTGHLARLMRERGFDWQAYDLFPRDAAEIPDTIAADTASILAFDFFEFDCVIMARPCHDASFIRNTFRERLETGDGFYVGKPDNIESDLAGFFYEVVEEDVGTDNESLVRIYGDENKTQIYRRIIQRGMERSEVWEFVPESNRYKTLGGLGGFPAGGEKVLDTFSRGNPMQIYLSKKEGTRTNTDMGWIAPSGEFFGCGYAMHDIVARAVIGTSVARLERLGFIRCSGDGPSGWTFPAAYKDETRRMTPEQAKMLRKLKYKVRRDDAPRADKWRA